MQLTRQQTLAASIGILASLILGLLYSWAGFPGFKEWAREITETPLPVDDPDYLYRQARDLYDRNDHALARDITRRIILLQPTHKEAYKLLAAIYLKIGDMPAAEAACRQATALDPSDLSAQLGLASALRRQGRLAEARRVFEQIAERADDADFHAVAQKNLKELSESGDSGADRHIQERTTTR